jgi:hypothetical protein
MKKYSLETRRLYKFLKEKRALKEYVENIMCQHKPCYYYDTANYNRTHDILQLILDNKNSIDYSFVWSVTPQGVDFWHRLDDEFEYTWLKYV